MSIKAILFDMDGVLIDARDWHYEALNKALDLFGMPIDHHAHIATFDGLPTRRKLEILKATHGLPVALHAFINEMKQLYTTEIIHARCRPIFHHQYALSRLKAQGYRLAVCSNSIRATVNLMMSLSRLEEYLSLQLSCEEVPRAKPAPDIYLEAMRQLDVAPHECLILEDNDHGIQAARASGGHLLEVAAPDQVTLDRIMTRIAEVEGA